MHNELGDEKAELEDSEPKGHHDSDTGAHDEVYYFSGLWCGGNHDRGPL